MDPVVIPYKYAEHHGGGEFICCSFDHGNVGSCFWKRVKNQNQGLYASLYIVDLLTSYPGMLSNICPGTSRELPEGSYNGNIFSSVYIFMHQLVLPLSTL